ncbi:hypothetical protein CJ196_05165 [Bifidobacterium breve]|nr:hypothetical protein CYJ38_05750 [Bifidobacterium breve]PMC73254.1 hypothetical protein CJ196_05165 [Bifidobacterium breve]RDX20483.1 hypothetical protein CE164_07115 [Bifidobacterium breve]RDX28099.1 hypothetical protein CE163_10660 [Bifidobacterium breve]
MQFHRPAMLKLERWLESADSNTFRPSCWSQGYRRRYGFAPRAHDGKEVRVRWTVIIPVVPPLATVIVVAVMMSCLVIPLSVKSGSCPYRSLAPLAEMDQGRPPRITLA